jgi:hypothetical protein
MGRTALAGRSRRNGARPQLVGVAFGFLVFVDGRALRVGFAATESVR